MPIVARGLTAATPAAGVLMALRRAGIPVGLGVAAPPKRRGLPVRLSGGVGAVVTQNFHGSTFQVPDVADYLNQVAGTWQVRYGNDTGYADAYIQRDPATAAAGLVEDAQGYCAQYPAACVGIDLPSVVAALQAQYSQWFQGEFQNGWGNAYSPNQSQPSPWAATNTGTNYNQTPQTVQPVTGGGQPTAYSVPNTIVPTYGTQTGGGGSTAAAPASSTGTGASGPVVLSLRNTSRPNMPLASGDRFELVITGPPNSPVSIDATRNDSQRGVSTVGNTDGQGVRIMTGLMGPSEIGSWVEVVTVGASSATISFSVAAAPTMSAGGPAPTGSGSATGGGGSTDTGVPGAAPMVQAPAASGLPSWVLPAAVAAAAVLMFRK